MSWAMTQAVPLPARGVRLEFSLPSNPNVASSLNLTRGPGGTWTGQGTNLSIDGQWDIDVVVQEAATAIDVPLRLRTRLPPEQITVSGSQASRPCTRSSWGTAAASRRTCSSQHRATAWFTSRSSGRRARRSPSPPPALRRSHPQAPTSRLKLVRLASGHFAANLSLTPGRWTFRIDAVPAGGQPLSGYFSQTIPP